jgi:uncharacterized metal-binding protein YceD (DUF177 family)
MTTATHGHPSPGHPGEVPPEFSRIVHADHLAREDVVESIEATPAECLALARRFDLQAIDRLSARLHLHRMHGGMIRVQGELEADVVQTCVVTLEPVAAHVTDHFDAVFAPESRMPEVVHELDLDPFAEDEDMPEPLVGGRIDLGELTAQHLSLALDPYPRSPQAGEAAGEEPGEEPGEERPHPFAVLARASGRTD